VASSNSGDLKNIYQGSAVNIVALLNASNSYLNQNFINSCLSTFQQHNSYNSTCFYNSPKYFFILLLYSLQIITAYSFYCLAFFVLLTKST